MKQIFSQIFRRDQAFRARLYLAERIAHPCHMAMNRFENDCEIEMKRKYLDRISELLYEEKLESNSN